jgi:hypothetical protein
MNLVKHSLPVSGLTIYIDEDPEWGVYEDIENFIADRVSKDVNQSGEITAIVDGKLQREHRNFIITSLLKKIESPNGEELSVTLDFIRKLSVKDGKKLNKILDDTWDSIKKKSIDLE